MVQTYIYAMVDIDFFSSAQPTKSDLANLQKKPKSDLAREKTA